MRLWLAIAGTAALAGAADVRNANWGMTRQQVIAVEGVPVEARADAISYGTVDFAGQHARLTYYFTGGKLSRAVYLFTASHEDPDQYVRDFQKLEPVLRQRHGKPLTDRAYWEDDDDQAERAAYLNQDRATPADLLPSDPFLGRTLLAGHLKLLVEWEQGGTRIIHGLAAASGRPIHELVYSKR